MDNTTENTSRFGGAVGAALLIAVLFTLVLGVFGAVYMDAFQPAIMRSAPPAPIASAPATLPSMTPSPTTTTPQPTVKTVAIPPAPAAAPVSRSAPAPAEATKLPYWIEYGAYDGAFYAERLVRRLGDLGIAASIRRVRGAANRMYFSVRSAATSDHAGVAAQAKLAAARIGIAPLIHRGGGAAPAHAVGALRAPQARGVASPFRRYWVQFGAYDLRGYAVTLRDRLLRAGVDAAVIERHRPGQARYLVRAPPTLRFDEARSVAARGESALGTPALVGQAPRVPRLVQRRSG
ncbi:MAG: SPOR domain-containing protein [Alphaproteobacteria bacterium]|nr:SPOR domain-containing protein [Alphaproteobacteria bacterium]